MPASTTFESSRFRNGAGRPAGWLLALALLLLGGLAVAARRWGALPRPQPDTPAAPGLSSPALPAPPAQAETPSVEAPPGLINRRWFRVALMIEGLALLTWLLLHLEPPYSTLVLAAVCVGLVAGARWRGTTTSAPVAMPPAAEPRPAVSAPRPDLTADRAGVISLLAGVALALMAVSAYFFSPNNPLERLPGAGLLLLAGGVVFMVAITLGQAAGRVPPLAAPTEQTGSRSGLGRVHDIMAGMGALLLLALAEINGQLFGVRALRSVHSAAQLLLLVAGAGLVVAGVGGLRLNIDRLIDRLMVVRWRPLLADAGLLLGVTALALGLRWWRLDDTVRMFVDELSFAMAIRRFWFADDVNLLIPMDGVAAFPNLFVYWQSWGVELFGRNFVGMRAASAVIGTLTIPAVYVLGRWLLDRKTALVAAVLLATFPPHMHFSRLALNNIVDALPGTLALACLGRGLLRNSRMAYALGGALLGLTHYFYEGGRLLYTPLALAWVLLVVVIWRPQVDWRRAGAALVTLALVAMPIYYTLTGLDKSFTVRMTDHMTGLAPAYWQDLVRFGTYEWHVRNHILPSVLFYVNHVERSLFYRGHTALVLAAVFPAFALGLFAALRRWRAPGMLLLLLWVGCTSAANSLMVDSAASTRFVVVFPALMLLAAVGIRYGLGLLLGGGRAGRWALAAVTVTAALFQVNYYFNQHLPLYNYQFRENFGHPDPQDAVLRSLDFPPETEIHLISRLEADRMFNNGALGFMRDGLTLFTVASADFTVDYIAELRPDVDHAFFVEPGDRAALALLEQHFYLLEPAGSPYDLPARQQFVLYYAPYLPGYSESLRPATP